MMSLATLSRSVQYNATRYVVRRRRMIAKASSGASFAFQAADAVGRCLYKRGVYEPELSDYLLSWRPQSPDAIFVDVGANIGYYSVHMALKGVAVLAFEPDPLNFELLSENLRRNNCQNVETHQLALSDADGVAPFYRYPEKNLGRHSLVPINDVAPIEVSTIRLDTLLQQRSIAPQRIEMIKIDVEGYEPLVVRGMERVLRECSPTIVAEFSPDLMQRGGLQTSQFVRLMRDAGYAAAEVAPTRFRPLNYEEILDLPAEAGTNLVWKKEGPQ